jgi:hypothetical protein
MKHLESVMKQPQSRLLILICLVPILGLLPSSRAVAQYNAVNSVLSLDGASYISVPYHDRLNINLTTGGTVSISAWVRPTTGGSEMTIVGNDRSFGYWFGLSAQGKLLYYPNPQTFYEGTATISQNTWTHVAVSFDAFKNNLRFYVNGSLDRQINTGQTYLGYGYFDLRIGADRQGNSPSRYWTGQLDEVRIWKLDIDFSTADGSLYRIPLAMYGGRYGRWMEGCWRFNGNAHSADRALDGSAVGNVAYLQTPDPAHYDRIGLQLTNGPDLGDHVSIQHSTSLTLTENYTLECWVRPSTTGGHSQYQTFISKGSYTRSTWNYWLGLNKSNGRVRFQPTGSFSNALESASAIPGNAWTHVAARFQRIGTTYQATIFINGQQSSTMNFAQAGSGNTYELLLGNTDLRSTGQTAYGYSGTIDEVRLWNTARSDDQIADHHRMEFNGPMTGLIACYRLDGDDLDRSGNGNDGSGSFRNGSFAYFVSTMSLPGEPTLALSRPVGGERWAIGDAEEIRWSASGLINVQIELSRDGGQNFSEVLANSVPASPGVFSWSVTGPVTSNAVVRVRPPSTTSLSDRSKTFDIEDPVPVLSVEPRQLVFTASQNGPLPPGQMIKLLNVGGATLSWTAQPSSALWYDLSAPSGTGNQDSLEVRINTTNFPVGGYSDNIIIGGNAINAPIAVNVSLRIVPLVSYSVSGAVRSETGMPIEGVKVLAAGAGDGSALTDANGKYEITGLPAGDYSITPVSPFFSFDPAFQSLQGLSSNQTDLDFIGKRLRGNVVIRYDAGWNLISLPLQAVPDGVKDVFPDTDGKAYEYVPSQGYVETDKLEFGKGYWLRFPKRDSVVVSGMLENVLDYSAQDQFGGWNLMGAPSGPAAVSGIGQNPAGALVVVYGYDPAVGYFIPPAGMLAPGRGYFVKVNTAALLHVVSTSFAPMYQSLEQLWQWRVGK